MKRVLVTGAGGFIGSHLVDRLLDEGHRVLGVDDLSGGRLENLRRLERDGTCWLRDFADPMVLQLVKNDEFDTIFHEAALPRVSYSLEFPAKTNDANVNKTVQLLEACRGTRTRFIFASSSSVYGGASELPTPNSHRKTPQSPYALQKSVCEDYCSLFSNLFDIDTVCLRYFNVFGLRQRGNHPYATVIAAWIDAVLDERVLRLDGDGGQTRDHCPIQNVVLANVLAMNRKERFKGECLNVACGERTSNNEILDALRVRFKLEITSVPPRQGDVRHSCADIAATAQALGYKPAVGFWDAFYKFVNDRIKEKALYQFLDERSKEEHARI